MSRVSINTYYQTALDLHKSGKLREARKLYDEILKIQPKHLESIFMKGQSFYQEKKYDEALKLYDQGLLMHPNNPDLFLQKGRALIKVGALEEAKSNFDYLVEHHGDNTKVLFHAARNMKELGLFKEAVALYKKVITLQPDHKQALNNLGNLFQQIYDYDHALGCYEKLIDIDPTFPMAFCNKAGLIQKLGKIAEAEQLYLKTLELDPHNSLALYNLGVIENARHNREKAIQFLQQSIQLAPDNHKYLSTYASTLYSNDQKKEGIDILRYLIKQGSRSEEPYLKLGKILMQEFDFDKFLNLMIPYLEQNKYAWESTFLTGAVLDFTNRHEQAEKFLLKVDKHPEFALRANMTLQLLYSKLGRVDKYEEMLGKVSSLLRQFVNSDRQDDEIPVYNLAYYPFDLELASQVTRKYSDSLTKRIKPLRERLSFRYQPKGEKIKIGYLSPNFRVHPDAMLAKDLFKYHDKNKFEVYVYSLRKSDDEISNEIRQNVDHFIDLDHLKVEDAAKKINEDGVNILVSLSGYNFGMKMEIPALRPAPVQAIYMGYNETLQSDFFDYAFGDQVTFTEENRKYFSESIAYLSPSYFLNAEMIPSNKKVTRKEYGLPENAIVFGCLNHPRKLSHWVVNAWFDILKQVPDSVLWLYHANQKIVESNLKKMAADAGINPDRLVFCGKEYYRDHYKRMKLIDLFVDTPVYNGHTTCLEALWMGIPVLTVQGQSVSSRLCSSFLHSIGMQEMVASNMNEYVTKAVALTEASKLDPLKKQFKAARENASLFKIQNLVKRLEIAYERMWQQYENGTQPEDIHVE
ncbi:tetratricopeptide repeat protein [Ekhidna sp.]|jgi:protein O-GlcNAc transferase|uniref:O-linked N-acetylglucosamine transferase family protein n=1 Tax=Ekhidna sp. TaxID=2608089 RepID=UPI0032ED3F3C